jgi:hypothetical protein
MSRFSRSIDPIPRLYALIAPGSSDAKSACYEGWFKELSPGTKCQGPKLVLTFSSSDPPPVRATWGDWPIGQSVGLFTAFTTERQMSDFGIWPIGQTA